MADEITVPILPCLSLDEMLAFYSALGFEATYKQARPYIYLIVRRGGIELHFFGLDGLNPADSYSTCIVVVPDADAMHQAFAAGLRQQYGRLPSAGIPRITRLRNKSGGTRGFNVIDPAGNWIRIVQVETAEPEDRPPKGEVTKLSRAVYSAGLLSDYKGDFEAAAKILDTALAHDEPVPPVQRVQALVARAEIAATMGDAELANRLLAQVRGLSLTDDDRAALADELQRLDDLALMLA